MDLQNVNMTQQITMAISISGMTLTEISGKMGISVQHLSNMLNGKKRFQLEHIESIAKILGMKLALVSIPTEE